MFKIYKAEASYRLIDILYDSWLFNRAVGAVGLGILLFGLTVTASRVFAESYLEYPKFTIGLLIFLGICSIGGLLPEQEESEMSKQTYNFIFTLKDAPGKGVLTHQIRAMNEIEAWRRFYRWVGNHSDKIVPDIIALQAPEAKEELKTTLDCWINEPYLALTNPPKLIWKCRYCGNEISTDVNVIPDKICKCLEKEKT